MQFSTLFDRNTRVACVLAMLLAGNLAQADVVVVVGASSTAAGLGKDQIGEIFLGRSTALVPMDQPESSPLREEFYTKVTGKSAAQAKAIWSKLAFTGKGTPPKEGANSTEIKKALSANPNMVGYIEKSAADSSVKTLLAP